MPQQHFKLFPKGGTAVHNRQGRLARTDKMAAAQPEAASVKAEVRRKYVPPQDGAMYKLIT